jgi:hypothetical protein
MIGERRDQQEALFYEFPLAKDLVGGEGFAIDASLIQADAGDRTRVEGLPGCRPVRSAEPSRNITRSSTMRRSVPRAR